MSNEEIINSLNAHATLLDSVQEPYLGYVHRSRTAAVIREAIALFRTHPPAGDNADKSSGTSARLAAIKDIPTQRLIELAMAEAAGLISILPSAAERARQDAQINEPLTFEELKKMDGKPVWLNTLCEWFFVDASCEPILLWGVRATCYSTVGLLGELYRRPPKEA